MDPDLFFQLHDLGATEWQINAVISGAMPAEALLSQLQTPAQAQLPQAIPSPEPIPVAPPPPLPVLADPVLPVLEAPEQPVVRAVPPPSEPPIEYVRVEPDPPVGGEGPALGSWLIDDAPANMPPPLPEPEVIDVADYPQFAGSGQILPFIASTVVSTATEKIFDKVGGGNSAAKLSRSPAGRSYRGRRRRRRLLTCSDKADIAYLVGQLGQGQLGKAAISALLSKRCG